VECNSCSSSSHNKFIILLYFSVTHLYPKTQMKSIYSCERNNTPSLPSEFHRYSSPSMFLDQFHFNMPLMALAPLHALLSSSMPQKCPHPSSSSEDITTSNNTVSLADADYQCILQMASHFKGMDSALISALVAYHRPPRPCSSELSSPQPDCGSSS
jgi:hypothetical protein